jgi:type VII secretion integral membrane protein EccD
MGGMTDSIAEPFRHGQGGGLPADAAEPDGFAAVRADGAACVHTGSEAGGEAGPQPPGSDVCRLTVYGPESSVELAVPVHVPLVDLLPALASHLGGNLADAGLEHGGWVLQRLGDRPLREELSAAALGLHDGDVVHLRPRSGQLPPADFDDLIDGVAAGIAGRPDRWRPELSRALLTGLLAVPLAAAAGLLAAGQPGSRGVAIAAVLALLALVSAGVASRAFGDRVTARLLGMAAVGYAAIAGSQLPLLHGGTGLLGGGNGPGATLLAAAAAATALALLAAMLTGGGDPVFAALIAVTGLAAVAGTFWAFLPVGRPQVAAVTLVLVVPLGALVPVLSFRVAGMRLDPPPTTPDELQANLDPVPGQYVLERTRWADRYMGALYTALGIVAGICLAVLGLAGGPRVDLVAGDAIVLLLLHARLMVAARQKLAAIVPAVAGAAIMITVAGLRASPHTRMLLVSGVTVAAGLLWAGQRTLPGRKLVPIWGRIGDLLESLTALALLPATLWLLNLFALARAVRL